MDERDGKIADGGVEQSVARGSHTPEVAGSSPAPAPNLPGNQREVRPMANTVSVTLCILWENEIRVASRAIHAFNDYDGDDEVQRRRLAGEAFEACRCALWDVRDGASLVLTSAPRLTSMVSTDGERS
jgi:hypothetical protein